MLSDTYVIELGDTSEGKLRKKASAKSSTREKLRS
jgi:hypothetical protein